MKTKHAESLKMEMEKKVAEHESLCERLKKEANEEKIRLAAQLTDEQKDKRELQQKFIAESEKISQIEKQNWWTQALQLKVKNMISDKLEK